MPNALVDCFNIWHVVILVGICVMLFYCFIEQIASLTLRGNQVCLNICASRIFAFGDSALFPLASALRSHSWKWVFDLPDSFWQLTLIPGGSMELCALHWKHQCSAHSHRLSNNPPAQPGKTDICFILYKINHDLCAIFYFLDRNKVIKMFGNHK